MILNQVNQAIKYLEYVVQQFPNNLAASRAYSTLGRLYYNQSRIDDAVNAYTQVYDKYPGTPEAKAAAQMVKGIYQETGRAPEYVKWAKTRGGIRFSEQDSLLYETAYALYEKSQYQQAINGFDGYLKDQVGGAFVINAHYFKALFHETLGQPANALVHYKQEAMSNSPN
ncbi:MAG: tetratricopeptide repeat protein [Bacteroidia bacterium]